MSTSDLIVIGGGPVGLVTALEARRAGLGVVVIDPRSGPIDKACGQGIMPAGVARLKDLGVVPDGAEITAIRYVSAGRSATAAFRHGPGLGVRRTELSARLWEAARAAGVRVIRSAATEFAPSPTHVTVRVRSGEEVRGAYLIGADGLHSRVRHLVSPRVLAPRRLRRFGFVTHVRDATGGDAVEVHWSARGEAYVTPLGGGETGVAVLARAGTSPQEVLAGLPEVRGLLGADAEFRGAGPFLQLPVRRMRDRMLLVGDAAGYADALTGEGLSVGFAQARAAVQAIATAAPKSYERHWWRVSALPLGLAAGLVTVTGPSAVRSRVVPAAAALPTVFASIVGVVAGVAEEDQAVGRARPRDPSASAPGPP